MQKNKLVALSKDMVKVLHGATNTSLAATGVRQSRHCSKQNVAFTLVDGDLEIFDSITRRFLQDQGFSEKFTEKYIEDKLFKIMSVCLSEGFDNKKVSVLLDALYNELSNYSTQWRVIVPIDGLTMNEVDELPIGQAKLFEMNEMRLNELASLFKEIILTTKHTDQEKSEIVSSTRERLGVMLGQVCAEVFVVAEPNRAKERAENQARLALEVLIFGIPLLFQDGLKVKLGLNGESRSFLRTIPLVSTAGDYCSIKHERIGSLASFEIKKETIELYSKLNVFVLSDILKKGSTINEFESILLRSLHWFASAINQSEIENKFLNLIIAAETLLTPKDGNPITTAIAEGIALILETQVDKRKNLKQLVKRLYGLRSAVSHGGKKVILEADYKTLQAIIGSLILKLLRLKNNFTKQQDLLDWIEDLKLT